MLKMTLFGMSYKSIIKHFPNLALDPYDIEAQKVDEFVRHVLDLAPAPFFFGLRSVLPSVNNGHWNMVTQSRTAEEIAKQLASLDQPMPETSAYLIECLNNPRYKVLNT